MTLSAYCRRLLTDVEERTGESMQHVRSRVVAAVKAAVRPARLLLVAKTAVVATGAWFIGRQLPGDTAEYALYAPLGALIAMTPTIASSVSASVKSMVALLVGLLSAWLLILSGVDGIATLALAVGIGTLLAGIPWFGPARDYIPLAAVFVFLVGGHEPDDYSLGFAAQFGLGAALGVLMNVLVPPPLRARAASDAVAILQEDTARCVERFVDALHPRPDDDAFAAWTASLDELSARAQAAQDELGFAWESRRGNARALRSRLRIDDADRAFAALQRMIRELEAVADSFSVDLGPDTGQLEVSSVGRVLDGTRESVAAAGRQVAALIRGVDASADSERTRHEVAASLRAIHGRIVTWPTDSMRDRERVYAFMFALHRILAELPLRRADRE